MADGNGVTQELLTRAHLLAQKEDISEETRLVLTLLIGIYSRTSNIGEKQAQLQIEVERIKDSVAQRVSDFVMAHPKATIAIAIVMLLISNAWWVSDIRKALLALIGLPEDLVPIP